jgi:fatty-acyl-CoA synthase
MAKPVVEGMSGWRNTAEVIVARYAVNLAGARVVSLYEAMSPPITATVMASVDCSPLLVDSQRHATVRELLRLAGVPQMLSLGPGGFAEDVLAMADQRPARPMGAAGS